MKKRIILGVEVLLSLLIAFGIITYLADSGRVTKGYEPKYCIKTINYDGSKVTYWGLGYKIISYVDVSSKESDKNNIGVSNWFKDYEQPTDTKKNQNNSISSLSLDDFYNTELTKNRDIRTLDKQYTFDDARRNNCCMIDAPVYNYHLYSEFMNDYNSKKTAFIRIGRITIEGDLILIDVLYDEKTDKVYVVTDNSRDMWMSEDVRDIKVQEFNYISEYQDDYYLHLVACNEDITESNYYTGNVYIIATFY